jgi:hypothetical protein
VGATATEAAPDLTGKESIMNRKGVIVLLAGIAVGCTEARGILEPPVPGPDAQFSALPEDRYPTEEEFSDAGGIFKVIHPTPVGYFVPGAWRSDETVGWRWANVGRATLTGSVVFSDGRLLNSQQHSVGFGLYRPVISYDAHLSVAPSTANHTCGLTGKVSLHAMAELWLLRFQLGDFRPFMLLEYDQTNNGKDVTQPRCEYEVTDPYEGEGGESCEGEGCYGDGGGNGGGGGSANGDDEGRYCTLWQVTVYESGDGGTTWYQIHSYQFWECH